MGAPQRPALFSTLLRSFPDHPWCTGFFLSHGGFKTDEKEEVVVSCLGSACSWSLLGQSCLNPIVLSAGVPRGAHSALAARSSTGVWGSTVGLSIVILFVWGRMGVGGCASDKDLCTPGSTGTSPAAFPAARRLKRMWASVSVEEDCVLGNATSARSRGEGKVGTTLVHPSSVSLLLKGCATSHSRMLYPQPCTLQGEAERATSVLHHHHLWFAAGEAEWRRGKGWVAGGHCPVPSPGQTCGCSN